MYSMKYLNSLQLYPCIIRIIRRNNNNVLVDNIYGKVDSSKTWRNKL